MIYTYISGSHRSQKKVLVSPSLGFRWFWELPCVFWELKLGPLKSSKCFQPPSLQPRHGHFLPRNSTSCHHPCLSTSISVSPFSHSSSCLCCLLYSSNTYTHECSHMSACTQIHSGNTVHFGLLLSLSDHFSNWQKKQKSPNLQITPPPQRWSASPDVVIPHPELLDRKEPQVQRGI